MTTAPPRGLTLWSIGTLVLAVPVWAFIVTSSLMSRVSDGGIFLSVASGISRGLPLYTGVWENKDPLFFIAMVGAGAINDTGPLVMDWLWIPIGALGGWLIARSLMSGDRALLVGGVLVPLILVGPFYQAGWAVTPGTSLTLLSLGLVMARWGVAAGIVLGLLAFTKLIVWPVAVACILVVLVAPAFRRAAVRAIVSALVSMAGVLALLAVAGWLVPYANSLQRNRAYASDVLVYFGFEGSPMGHLTKLAGEWQFSQWIATGIVAGISVLLLLTWVARPVWRTPERGAITLWVIFATVGTAGSLSLSYVWGHHAQAVYLPTSLAVIGIAALLPERWPYLVWLGLTLAIVWGASGMGTGAMELQRYETSRNDFAAKWAEMSEVPTDARLLNSVPIKEFTFARLGTNDDRGFLTAVRDGATLGCPEFHLYDFSPPTAFENMLDCLKTVDVVLKTDNFDAFARGARAANALPVLDYLGWGFNCLRIGDRQLCTRKET